jgi:HD-GYP domain-containing protein (c-di-GMP phosphodiesterase class II)
MSSGQPSDVRSSEPEPAPSGVAGDGLAAVVRERGAPLLDALEERLPGGLEHAEATASYAFAAAAGLGLARDLCEAIREAARLHDVGRLYVPTKLLSTPPGELSSTDLQTVTRQFEWGYRLAVGAGISEPVSQWIRWAGERFDGTGPSGIAGEDIEVASRVIRAACTCDLLLAAPTAREIPAFERRRLVIGTLRAKAGSELDPAVVEALATMLSRSA